MADVIKNSTTAQGDVGGSVPLVLDEFDPSDRLSASEITAQGVITDEW